MWFFHFPSNSFTRGTVTHPVFFRSAPQLTGPRPKNEKCSTLGTGSIGEIWTQMNCHFVFVIIREEVFRRYFWFTRLYMFRTCCHGLYVIVSYFSIDNNKPFISVNFTLKVSSSSFLKTWIKMRGENYDFNHTKVQVKDPLTTTIRSGRH